MTYETTISVNDLRPAVRDFVIHEGDTIDERRRVQDEDGNLLDLTAYTVSGTIRDAAGAVVTGTIEKTDNIYIRIYISAAESPDLPTVSFYEIEITSGTVRRTVQKGKITVNPSIDA